MENRLRFEERPVRSADERNEDSWDTVDISPCSPLVEHLARVLKASPFTPANKLPSNRRGLSVTPLSYQAPSAL